jgi:hypothetical protein
MTQHLIVFLTGSLLKQYETIGHYKDNQSSEDESKTPETSCFLNILQKIDNVQTNIGIISSKKKIKCFSSTGV